MSAASTWEIVNRSPIEVAKCRGTKSQYSQLRQHFPLGSLPFELREEIWAFSLPDRRIICIYGSPHEDPCNEDKKRFFIRSAAPPVLLHVCHESRNFALKHFKPYFIGPQATSRPIYLRPKHDIVFLDMDSWLFVTFALKYPEVQDVTTVIIPEERNWRESICDLLWGHNNNLTAYRPYYQEVKKLLLADQSYRRFGLHRYDLAIELTRDLTRKPQEQVWEEYITDYRLRGFDKCEVQAVKTSLVPRCYED